MGHRDSSSEPDEANVVEVRAELDLPGETGRQVRIFAVWFVCLALAVIIGSAVGAHIAVADGELLTNRDRQGLSTDEALELSRSRIAKAKVALAFGLLLPSLLTFGLNRRYRRGGRHARGITVDVTIAGELRIWGRGYGTRIFLQGADVSERLVDVYAGRLGAWRQRRLHVRAGRVGPTGVAEIELATTAQLEDLDGNLRVEGGEGNCVELERDDFDHVRRRVLEVVRGEPATA